MIAGLADPCAVDRGFRAGRFDRMVKAARTHIV